jgi:hypothetical protein
MTALIANQNPDIQKSHAYAPPRANTQYGEYSRVDPKFSGLTL